MAQVLQVLHFALSGEVAAGLGTELRDGARAKST